MILPKITSKKHTVFVNFWLIIILWDAKLLTLRQLTKILKDHLRQRLLKITLIEGL